MIIPLRPVPGTEEKGDKKTAPAQFKPNTPRVSENGRPVKYETPTGFRCCIDVPPGVERHLKDHNTPLIVTEGVKKADSAASRGLACVALLGVNSWDLPDWDGIVLSHRKVYIIFDSDVMLKREVALAMKRLTHFLRSRGATVQKIFLPSENGEKVGLDDYFVNGGTAEELVLLTRRTRVDGEVRADLPVIESQRHDLETLVDQAIEALVGENDPPVVFNQLGRIVRVRVDELRGQPVPRLETMDKDMIIDRLSQVANWMTTNQSGRRPINPPDVVARMIKARSSLPGLPNIRRVVGGPVFTDTGEFCGEPGFNAEGQVYVCMDSPIRLPKRITKKDVEQAVALLDNLICDFPFEDAASRAHTFAFMLLPFVRDLIDGPTPLHLFDAPRAGTGKSKLMSLCASIFSVEAGFLEDAPTSDDEWRKRLTATFLEGGSHVLIDDVATLRSHALQSAITNPLGLWKDRLLSKNENARVAINVVWGVSGNNMTARAELLRRCVHIRLNAKMERPETRTDFKIKNPESYVSRHRVELMTACAILVQYWVDDLCRPGSPKVRLGSFESWTDAMSGILGLAGVDGFLENQSQLMRQADDENAGFVAFFRDWQKEHGSRWVGAKDLLVHARRHFEDFEVGLADNAVKVKLGKFLSKHRDVIHTGLLLSVKSTHDGNLFRLTPVDG